MMRGRECGYLTVYMTLTLAVLLSLCLTMVEGARKSAMRMQAEVVTYTAMRSVLAEYNRELAKQYNIFAVDSSYGTTLSGADTVSDHFSGYMNKNYEYEVVYPWARNRDFLAAHPDNCSVSGIRYLTDGDGRVFRECAIDAIKDDYGIVAAREVIDWASSSEIRAADSMDVYADMSGKDGTVSRAASAERSRRQAKRDQEERDYEASCKAAEEKGEPSPPPPDYTDVPEEYRSPVSGIAETAKTGILGLILDDPENLSRRYLDTEKIISGRMAAGMINAGNLEYENPDESLADEVLGKALFGEYLIRYMGYYGSTSPDDALWYQIEYIISGESSDTENLNKVVCMILAIRAGMDLLYLESDSEKKNEAELLSAAICTLCMIPSMTDTLTQAILAGWAVAEARYDVRTLLGGGRIDFIKSSRTWHTGLNMALSNAETGSGGKSETGMSYKDYLRIFLFMCDTDIITARAMDIAESDIRLTAGNMNFRMDACAEMIECQADISNIFGSRVNITRKPRYR